MKKLILILLLAALLMMGACSQHKPQAAMKIPMPSKRLYTLQHELGLSVEQMELMQPILEEEYDKKTALAEALTGADDEERKSLGYQVEDLEWETFKKLTAHMNQEQVDKYVEFLLREDQPQQSEQPREEPGERPQRGGPGPRR